MNLSVSADIPASQELLGKYATDLQSDIVIGSDNISGTLNYVTEYTGFSGTVSEQSGNYLALYCNVSNASDATITVELVGGYKGPVNLDDDGLIVIRITSVTQSIKVIATKSGHNTVTKTFALTNLILSDS